MCAYTPIRESLIKILEMKSAGEDTEKLNPSVLFVGMRNSAAAMRNGLVVP